ncbi:MAG: hypothetical protein ACO2ZM_07345, partial [Francisellaceae bacterium]
MSVFDVASMFQWTKKVNSEVNEKIKGIKDLFDSTQSAGHGAVKFDTIEQGGEEIKATKKTTNAIEALAYIKYQSGEDGKDHEWNKRNEIPKIYQVTIGKDQYDLGNESKRNEAVEKLNNNKQAEVTIVIETLNTANDSCKKDVKIGRKTFRSSELMMNYGEDKNILNKLQMKTNEFSARLSGASHFQVTKGSKVGRQFNYLRSSPLLKAFFESFTSDLKMDKNDSDKLQTQEKNLEKLRAYKKNLDEILNK